MFLIVSELRLLNRIKNLEVLSMFRFEVPLRSVQVISYDYESNRFMEFQRQPPISAGLLIYILLAIRERLASCTRIEVITFEVSSVCTHTYVHNLRDLGSRAGLKFWLAPQPPGMRLNTFSILKSQVSEPQISSNG